MGCNMSAVKIPVTGAFIKDADSETGVCVNTSVGKGGCCGRRSVTMQHQATDEFQPPPGRRCCNLCCGCFRRKPRGDSATGVESVQLMAFDQNALTLRAILIIQRWYRRYLARLEARRLQAWSIYESLEYANENDQTRLYNFFNDILAHVEGGQDHEFLRNLGIAPARDTTPLSDMEEEEELRRTTNPDDVKIESGYRGIHIKMPMTTQQLQALIQAFKHKKEIHAKYVLVILHQVRLYLKKMPNINYVSTLSSKRITIIGDLHGKLDDLFIILFKNGLPSTENPYVFNGDFVDRGSQSLEVVMVLFATFLLNPTAIFFNRGNHEDYVMNLRYGFAKEIMTKYQHEAGKIVRLFQDVFSWLPLLTIIDKKILITHGGISDQTDLDLIMNIPRHKYLSILRPPVEEDADGMEMIDAEAWRQLLDILWSDPKNQLGCTPNTFRGGGVNWGPDITSMFMAKYNLNLIIRSHECKPEGYEYTHDNKVLTLFSASNYYEVGSNKGAFAQLLPMPKELMPHIIQYIFTEATGLKKLTIKQRISTIEESAITGLREKLLANKTALMKEFQSYDKDHSGFIKAIAWCKVMGETLNMELPWRSLATKLAHVDSRGMVEYGSTFDNNEIVFDLLKSDTGGGASFTEILYRNKDNLETIFRAIDKDNSGHISMEEFGEACAVLCQHTGSGTVLSRKDVQNMARAMDQNKDGQIDFNEFLEAFRIVDHQHNVSVGPKRTPSAGSRSKTH